MFSFIGDDPMHRGYIKLWRKIRDNSLWPKSRPYTKNEAWIDLIMEAQHAENPRKIMFGMVEITSSQGDCCKSLETWAARWNWSRASVFRFFRWLQKRNMIETKPATKTKHLTIVNYSIYNGDRNENETHMKRKRNAHETDVTHKQECKECGSMETMNNTPLPPRGDEGWWKTYGTKEGAAAIIYSHYPRKIGKAAAIMSIIKAMNKIGGGAERVAWMIGKVKRFASSPAGQAGPYCPHPATWFNGGRYDDDEAQWQVVKGHTGISYTPPPDKTPAERAEINRRMQEAYKKVKP